MNSDELLLAAHLISTALMTGLIWFVQVVHYPLFARVGAEAFTEYEREHQWRTTLVVAPLMLIELGASAWILLAPPDGIPRSLALVGLALVVLVWLSTALVQVPLHAKLASSFDSRAAARLVATNWVRTLAWSARTIIAVAMLCSGAAV